MMIEEVVTIEIILETIELEIIADMDVIKEEIDREVEIKELVEVMIVI
jgi:hypothetical protein